MSKYPRTFHLPWSPGGTNDDKRLKSVETFLNKPVIITEKLDGSNFCIKKEGVFARSHNQIASHPSFNYLKSKYNTLKYLLKDNEEFFGENCYAIHSIEYQSIPEYFFIFGIREKNTWKSFSELKDRCLELGLLTPPVLFEGIIKTSQDLERITTKLSNQNSVFGSQREGIVIRLKSEINDSDFGNSVAKWVRKDHVQTDDHWMFQKIRKQRKIDE